MFNTIPQNLCLFSIPYPNNKICVNPCNPWLKIAKVANTGCPIATLILQNEPNFHPFWLKNNDSERKRTQTNPIQTQSNPIYHGVVPILFTETKPDFGHLLLNTEYRILEPKSYE
jgi:hypothetical protein